MGNNVKLLENLRSSYHSLSKSEKITLQMFSIIYEPITQTSIMDCLRKWRFRDENGRAINQKSIRGIMDKLESLDLVALKNGYICCRSLLGEVTLNACEDGVFESMLSAIREMLPSNKGYYSWSGPYERYIREIRVAVYNKEYDSFEASIKALHTNFPKYKNEGLYSIIFNSPFCPTWFKSLPFQLQANALINLMDGFFFKLDPVSEFLPFLEEYQDKSDEEFGCYFRDHLITVYVLQGKFEKARKIAQKDTVNGFSLARLGWIDFLSGNNSEAIAHFSNALGQLKKNNRKKNVYFTHMSGMFYLLALIKADDPSYLPEIAKIIENAKKSHNAHGFSYNCIKALVSAIENLLNEAKDLLSNTNAIEESFLNPIIYSLTTLWFFPDLLTSYGKLLKVSFQKAVDNKYEWAAMEFAEILARLYPQEKKYGDYAKEARSNIGAKSILSIIRNELPWERSLKALERLNQANSKKDTKYSSTRLVWFITEAGNRFFPKEQTLNAKGIWSKGRPVALERIKRGKLDCMTAQDHTISKAIHKMEYPTYGYYTDTVYELNYDEGLPALVGHPLIYLEGSPNVSAELLRSEPELMVEQKGNEFEIKFSMNFEGKGVEVIKESPTRFKVVKITAMHQKIKYILGDHGLIIPDRAKDNILNAIKNLSSLITVHSNIDGQASDIPTVNANPQTCVHLLPIGNGIKLEMFVKPFQQGPYFKPGSGGMNVFAEIKGQRVQTQRNLQKEAENAREVLTSCPSLATLSSSSDTITFEKPDECLSVLLELRELKDKILVEWPEGEKMHVSRPVSFNSMSLSIRKERDWFGVSGELKVDESLKLDIQKLLELIENTPGRFIPLGDGHYLTLTREFQRRVAELGAVSERTKTGLKFHPLACLPVLDLVDNGIKLKTDKDWTTQVNSIKKSLQFQPTLPSTLQAELRSYQVEGFNWLSRLADWGVGACLADDMGLGKTLQALAIMLDRAGKGPALVVAPASVCFNWIQEASRFAPTLNIEFFGGRGREEKLEKLKAFDILICTYGLLQNEIEKLTSVKWETIILDEAQAIKNVSSKRSKAAMQLQGKFKLITTGTPIENNLGELWNLFRFINPGLLGSLERFKNIFAGPIERNQDIETRNRLKRVIQPFILRRIKSQVLEELPPKTEITLSVALTPEEASFYEALRQQALKKLDSIKGDAKNIRFQILAEIMKLRRACCHSSLVLPESQVASSKLSLFAEVIEELMANRHKSLVFSQFVGHLNIIREKVFKMGISYQYLDGSTPLKERKKRVESFQAGDGDLFLISLKAGGLGLNLTAADYVIHMDPWWNPAVEDQASDRAHRIGQQRPVTIYRLVTKNTIEEKIVNLHKEKRNLADSLLEGTESSGKISSDQLLQLIKEV